VQLHHSQARHQAFDVFNAQPAHQQGQARPVEPALAVGQQARDLVGCAVGIAEFRRVFALVIDVVGRGVDEGD
jgi:hypothetical protein